MTTFAVVQAIIIGALVLGSAIFAFRRLLPGTSTRWMASASASLNKPWRKPWVQAMGRWLQPASATGNCGDGCGTCGSCGPKPPANARPDVQPLEFRPRNKG
ncbi:MULTISPECIES: DUF6587 family protein [Dyella]|uniref:Uncharacterized protein n=2 Tax=Dyella TaxID=231454 RepID=A0A4R0YTA7_9GAMM|nr:MULTISPECIES: DUF6587 family protein [Dyella]TBR39817.1 hypothetical protein EYV96_06440 [Dyella terrae]TCI12603.1 hypothetical protein EZM97_04430 [Dyella soli]